MSKEVAVRLGNGTLISLSDLPERKTKHWVASNKTSLVKVYMAGLVSREEIIEQYDLEEEELQNWLDRYVAGGKRALKAVG